MGNPNLGAGPGRPKGLANKSTQKAREAISLFVEGNIDRLQDWLDQIAEKDPEKAYRCFMDVIEYHIPKLQRSELTGADGKDLIPDKVTIEYVEKSPALPTLEYIEAETVEATAPLGISGSKDPLTV